VKKIFPIMLISILFLTFIGCHDRQGFRVFYHKGTSDRGSVPVDPNIYQNGDIIYVLDKGTLEKDGHMFLGWKDHELIHRPYSYFEIYTDSTFFTKYTDLHFLAIWNDDLNDTFDFVIEGDEVKITKYKYHEFWNNNVVIPSTYSDKPVIEIADEVFKDSGIRSVSLSRNIKIIGAYAFANSSIRSLVIPDSVELIGSYAFANCSIYSLVIPDSVESIGIGAFENNFIGYQSFGTITFGTGLTSIPQGAFKRNGIKSVSLPENITLIEDEAFFGNTIGQIIIGAGVEIESDTSFGTRGASFKKFYDDGGKKAGEYGYTADFWVKL